MFLSLSSGCMADSGSIYSSATDPGSLHLRTERFATAGLENGRVDTGGRDGWEVGTDMHTRPHVTDGEREPAVKRQELGSASVRAQRGAAGGAWDGGPGGSRRNPPASARDASSIPGTGRSPGAGTGDPLQHFCLGKSHAQRSLEGYRQWGLRVRYY